VVKGNIKQVLPPKPFNFYQWFMPPADAMTSSYKSTSEATRDPQMGDVLLWQKRAWLQLQLFAILFTEQCWPWWSTRQWNILD
jgi:hypothetical protein